MCDSHNKMFQAKELEFLAFYDKNEDAIKKIITEQQRIAKSRKSTLPLVKGVNDHYIIPLAYRGCYNIPKGVCGRTRPVFYPVIRGFDLPHLMDMPFEFEDPRDAASVIKKIEYKIRFMTYIPYGIRLNKRYHEAHKLGREALLAAENEDRILIHRAYRWTNDKSCDTILSV